jgi:hypothetical protein
MHLRRRAFGLERPVKWLALYVPVPWPRGYPAPHEIEQLAAAGTPPAVFDYDRETLLVLMEHFTQAAVRGRRHPLWGRMSEWEWGRGGYLHTDHHLRQFGHSFSCACLVFAQFVGCAHCPKCPQYF